MPSHRPLSRKSPKTASGSSEKRQKHSKHTTGRVFNFISILMYFRRKTADYFRSNFSSIQTLILRFGYLCSYYRYQHRSIAISQDWPTEESFERKEIFKWRNISDAIYKIQKVKFRKGKYGDSAILTLETKNGDEFCVWAPKRLTEDLMEDVYYQFVYKMGPKTSADGNEYFDYELM